MKILINFEVSKNQSTMVESQTIYTAVTSWGQPAAANSNLDGTTGSYKDVAVGSDNGLYIKTVIIKAIVSTSQDGMIRFFIEDGSTVTLIMEVTVPIVTKSGRDVAYFTVIPFNYRLEKNVKLIVSTQLSNNFNVIAECYDWQYASPAPDFDNIQYLANISGNKISVANPNLDGTGVMKKIFEARQTIDGYSGCEILSIRIKALGTVTPGMVRLFFRKSDEETAVLFCEVVVPAVTQTGADRSFSHEVLSEGTLLLQSGYAIWASTENAENFAVTIEGRDWLYP